MVDVSAISGLMTALKGATDIGRAAIGLRDAELLRAKVIDMQTAILAAQSAALDAKEELATKGEEIRKLKEELAIADDWRTEASRYELFASQSGTVVYRLRPDASPTEPSHMLCPTCFHMRRKTILKKPTPNTRDGYLHCSVCDTPYVLSKPEPEQAYVMRAGRGWEGI